MAECKDCVDNVTCVERRYFGGNQKNCGHFIDRNKYVEVVRCKDCKHWHEETGWCNQHSHFVQGDGEACHPWESSVWKMLKEDDFCSYGERREGE